jgi:hypothetical protein
MDYYSGKGFVFITIDTGEGPIVLLDTHLHANYARPGESDDYVGIRAAQTIQISAALSQVAHPVVALGDFNLVENEDAYAMLLGLSGLSDVAASLDRRENTSLSGNPYHRAGHVDQRIDYVLIRNGPRRGLRAVSIERIFDRDLEFRGERGAYSDHAGLAAELEFASGVEEPAPMDADALKIATQLLEEGRMISDRRKRRQRTAATGALAAGLASLAGARKAEGSRRYFLRNSLRVASGLGLAGFLEQAWLSEWMTRGEHAGYDFAEQQLSNFDIIIDIDRTGR